MINYKSNYLYLFIKQLLNPNIIYSLLAALTCALYYVIYSSPHINLSNYLSNYNLNIYKYIISFIYLSITILLAFKFYPTKVYIVILAGLLFRAIIIYFNNDTSFVNLNAFSHNYPFLGYFAIESFSLFNNIPSYIPYILSLTLDFILSIVLFNILKHYKKHISTITLIFWNPLWIDSIYTNFNPLIIYVFLFVLGFFFIFHKQFIVASVSISFAFPFFHVFYLFLPLFIYSLRYAFILLVAINYFLLSFYKDYIVTNILYSQSVQDILEYLSSGFLISFDTFLALFIFAFFSVSLIWLTFLKISFFDKVYIFVFALMLIFPYMFNYGLSLLVILFGGVYMNFGFLCLSLFVYLFPTLNLPFLNQTYNTFLPHIIIAFAFVYIIIKQSLNTKMSFWNHFRFDK